MQEREVKGSSQADTARLVAENRKLERQRGELIAAFKKQLKLIEARRGGGGRTFARTPTRMQAALGGTWPCMHGVRPS